MAQQVVAPDRDPWERYGWLMAAIWLVFLGFPIHAALTADRPVALRVVALLALIAFVAVYLHALIRIPERHPTSERLGLLHLVAMVALTGVVCAVAGEEGLGTLPYVVALAMFTLRLWASLAVALVCVALPPGLTMLGVAEPGSEFLGLICVLVAVTTLIVRLLEDRSADHREVGRELEIVAERERVARDVHDVLGHSLTVVAAKAELADRLVDIDPDRAHAELRQIQSLTREAIAEIRATVSGLRVARLGDELAAAEAALSTAGIDTDLPGSTDVVDPRHRMVLAWVLREAVTNVVRHSRAERCTVALAPRGLVVSDDGCGVDGAAEGNGLRGIRERVAAAGGTLDVRTGPDGRGTVVEVSW